MTHGSTWFAFNCDQNSCILVTCDNTYTMKSKDEMYLLTFSFIQYSLSFATSLSHATCLRRLKEF
jgi:hypothetical protein